jgi:hypothetical protein
MAYILSYVHQIHDMITVYPVYIISSYYPTLYHIMSVSYPDHQTGSYYFIKKKLNIN